MATTQIKKDPAPDHLKSLVGRMAAEYGVDRDKFYATLANSIFAQGAKDRDGKLQPKVPTPEEMLALLVVCDKFKLDPFTRQIFAFSSKRGKIVPIVSIDGWLSIINRQPDYDGLEVVESQNLVQIGEVKIPEFCTVKIYRKSLSRPITISEYASEVFVPTNDVWRKYPRRMLRHKAIVQAARVAFSISGIYDRDDAMSIAANEDVVDVSAREVGTETAAAPERPHRTIAYKSRKELDGALDAAVKSALLRGDWTAAEKWVRETLEGTQRDYGLAYLEDRREQMKPQQAVPEVRKPDAASLSTQAPGKAPLDDEPPMPPAPVFGDMAF